MLNVSLLIAAVIAVALILLHLYTMVSVSLLIAAVIAIVAMSLHIYTFEACIWPRLRDEGFPSFPFGPPRVVKGFYRTVWHFLTVSLLLTIVVLIAVAFANQVPYGLLLVWFLIIFWILIVVEMFIVAALSLQPGDSYIKSMVRDYEWVIILVMVLFMYNGARG